MMIKIYQLSIYSKKKVMIRSLIVSVSEDRQIESIIGVQWDSMVHRSSWKRGSANFPTFRTGTVDPRGALTGQLCTDAAHTCDTFLSPNRDVWIFWSGNSYQISGGFHVANFGLFYRSLKVAKSSDNC